ncbi:MAG: cyclic nucleotide-binding domain-containing protein, partial [bacterium]
MKKEEFVKIRDQAARAMKKNNWDKAREKYEQLVKAQPKDLRLRMKLADILVKLNETEEAAKILEEVGESYAADGFLIQAISVYKLLQQVDPERSGVDEKLEELNQARGVPTAPAARPAAAPDGEPGFAGEKSAQADTSLAEEVKEARDKKEESRKSAGGSWTFPDTPLFGKLGEEEFKQVVSRFQVGTIPKKFPVIEEGTKGDSFFIVSHGDVRVFRTHPKTGKKITLARLKDGAFFGEMAFFLDSVRTASCETAEETVLLRINREDLEELMMDYPNIRAVMQDFFKRRALDQLFKTTSLFASLEETEQEVLMDKFELVKKDPGEFLIQEGEEGTHLYVIFAGEAEVTTQHEDKGPVKLATLGPGDYCGEISMLQG